jgi:hypothetical protein
MLNDLQGKVSIQGGISNGNEEEGYQEGCQKEKEVTLWRGLVPR